MKKAFIILIIIIVVGAIGFFALRSYTKSKSPEETITYSEGGLDLEINYCRPYKKGRKVFGELVPYNEVWRTGANEATLIEFDEDVIIAGKQLLAGKYSLWTIPTPSTWTIIFNEETGQWGTNYDSTKNITQVVVPSRKIAEQLEQFKMDFQGADNGADLVLKWENTEVIVPIRNKD